MADNCEIHPFERADDRCGDCGRTYCMECIVYAFGPRKPPMCKACAITAAGIRKNSRRAPVLSGRQRRKVARTRKKEARQSRKPTEAAPASTEAVEAPEATPSLAVGPDRKGRTTVRTGVAAGLAVIDDTEVADPARGYASAPGPTAG